MPETFKIEGKIVSRKEYLLYLSKEKHVRRFPIDPKDDYCVACGFDWPCPIETGEIK